MPLDELCAGRMIIGAKIMLNTGVDTAREGLAKLADNGWMMSLPQQDSRSGRPGGRAWPGLSAPGTGRESAMVAVTFGKAAVSAGPETLLTVRWESADPGEFTVLLDADITLAPATGQARSTLTLAGVCRLPPGTLITDGLEMARTQLIEAAREFITSVADAVTGDAANCQQQQPRERAWSWLTGLPRQREA